MWHWSLWVSGSDRDEESSMTNLFRSALSLLLILTAITGVLYPLAVTGLAQLLFPTRANGSLITRDGRAVGSELIGQPFDDPSYFWSRPSATAPQAYNGGASTGSNLGPTNEALREAVARRIEALRVADPGAPSAVPIDLVTASGSGLDPHLSPAAALFQVGRVANRRGLSEDRVRALVWSQVEGRTFGLLGEPRVNVLRLNLALDALSAGS
jgi:K+-transporting ATPase ATPase C chain